MQVRLVHVLYVALGLSVLGGGVWVWRVVADEREERQLEDDLAGLRKDARGRSHSISNQGPAARWSSESREELERELVQRPTGDPLELGPQEAVDAFASVMQELEQAVDDEREFGETESAELYNRATGSFEAMSGYVDAGNPRERALLDDAHARMVELLGKLEIRPPKRELDGFVSVHER